MCICLRPEFDCPEVTLCGWQDIKIQLLLLLLVSDVGADVRKSESHGFCGWSVRVWACVCLTKTDGLNCFSLHPRLWHFLCPSLRDTRNPSFVFLIPYPSLFSSCTTSPGKITTHKCTEVLACLDFKSFKCIWVQMSSSWAGLTQRLGVRLVSRGTSVRNRFGSPFSSKVVVCGHCLVTLSSQLMKH